MGSRLGLTTNGNKEPNDTKIVSRYVFYNLTNCFHEFSGDIRQAPTLLACKCETGWGLCNPFWLASPIFNPRNSFSTYTTLFRLPATHSQSTQLIFVLNQLFLTNATHFRLYATPVQPIFNLRNPFSANATHFDHPTRLIANVQIYTSSQYMQSNHIVRESLDLLINS